MGKEELKEEIKKDIGLYSSIESIGNLDGGKELIRSLESDVVSGVDMLLSIYRTGTEMEIRATLAKLASDLALLRVLNRARENKQLAEQELKRILGE